MSEAKAVFSSDVPFTVAIASGGVKRCTVRFPTDAEWTDRAYQQVIIYRGVESDSPNAEKADLALLGLIRQDKDGPDFDEFEASDVIGKLEACKAVGTARSGEKFEVSLKVPGGIVKHVLSMPTLKQQREFGKRSASPKKFRHHTEVRVNLGPAGELWDACMSSTEGYQGAVPIIHKDAAVIELLTAMREMTEELESPLPEVGSPAAGV